jgi:hypothetical protein
MQNQAQTESQSSAFERINADKGGRLELLEARVN